MYPIVFDSVLHYREYIGANSTFLDTRPLHCMAPLTSPDITTRRPPPLPPPPRPFPPPVVVSKVEHLHINIIKYCKPSTKKELLVPRIRDEGIPTEGTDAVFLPGLCAANGQPQWGTHSRRCSTWFRGLAANGFTNVCAIFVPMPSMLVEIWKAWGWVEWWKRLKTTSSYDS